MRGANRHDNLEVELYMSRRIARDDIEKLHDYGIHVSTRTIYIGSEPSNSDEESGVDYLLAERTIKNIHILENISADPITIIMNNIGGDTMHGFAIYDAIKNCRCHVTIKGTGNIMSMATVILQAGDERLLSEHTTVMLHYGENSTAGHVKNTQNWIKFYQKMDRKLSIVLYNKIKEKNPRFSLQKLERLLEFDTILDADEAVNLGLADGKYGGSST